ncbi:MAG: acyl-CoA/acyl-ACP dehydrogenase [Desulfobacterales bacterium]|nr:acyl-CoA/acyl-ACP dehydrogenase [Desulfobacterales bacterium]
MLSDRLIRIEKEASQFAKEVIFKKSEEMISDSFPLDIWQQLSDAGWLGVSLPKKYGGMGHGYAAMSIVGHALASHGYNLGIVLSWMIHLAVARSFILNCGQKKQQDALIPQLASGKQTAVFAVSEPQTGAHPKFLKTRARQQGNTYVLTGEKTFLTNGPIADWFIVIAITHEEANQKSFSAFLVPKQTDGLTITPLVIERLKPAPHCSIQLTNCSIPATYLLGKKGTAYEDMVKPFREIEDMLMMGPITGALTALLQITNVLLKTIHTELSVTVMEDLGRLCSLIHTLRVLSYESAKKLDNPLRYQSIEAFPLSFRWIALEAQNILDSILNQKEIEIPHYLEILRQDVRFAAQIAMNATKIKFKKMGEMGIL